MSLNNLAMVFYSVIVILILQIGVCERIVMMLLNYVVESQSESLLKPISISPFLK